MVLRAALQTEVPHLAKRIWGRSLEHSSSSVGAESLNFAEHAEDSSLHLDQPWLTHHCLAREEGGTTSKPRIV